MHIQHLNYFHRDILIKWYIHFQKPDLILVWKYISSIMKIMTESYTIWSRYYLHSLWCMQWQSDSCQRIQRKSWDHLKCCPRLCIQFSGHSSLRWWMKRKVEEDMVNVATNPCVLFYFLSPEISRHNWAPSLQLKLKVVEPMDRPLWFSGVLFVFLAQLIDINPLLLLLFTSFSC